MLTRSLEGLYDWLSAADRPGQADVIFVLAGRQSRKHYALELFGQGVAGTLLISVGRFEIRKFAQLPFPVHLDMPAIARDTPPAFRHYFVSLHAGQAMVERIARGRFGTLSEIRALAAWLNTRPGVRSLLVVSSAPHLRRVRACCRALLAADLKLCFVPPPSDGWLARSRWWREPRARSVVLKEIAKLLIYWPLLRVVTTFNNP